MPGAAVNRQHGPMGLVRARVVKPGIDMSGTFTYYSFQISRRSTFEFVVSGQATP